MSRLQSTHSKRSATCLCSIKTISGRDFNPRTPSGVRRLLKSKNYGVNNFNPRTPSGVRHNLPFPSWLIIDFNPRTPSGVRRSKQVMSLRLSRLQSTHSKRSATLVFGNDRFSFFLLQSTHSKRSATRNMRCRRLCIILQSTHSKRSATIPTN